MNIRLAIADDVPAILAITNHYALTTPANFAVEPEPLSMWRDSFDATHERYPWLVAVENHNSSIAESSSTHTHSALTPNPSPLGRGELDILGFAKASPWKGRCAYAYAAEVTVYIAPHAQGRGVGRALYEMLFEIMRRQGYCTIFGGITLPNDASVALHERFGMKRIALQERVGWKFGRWHDVGYWQGFLRDDSHAPPPERIRSVREVWAELQAEDAMIT